MATNVYECMFLLDSNRYARNPNGVAGKLPELIQGAGGEVLAERLWNEQRLAYPINGQRKGTYWLTYFRLDSAKLTEFNRACRLNENILRHLVLKIDPRLVDALVSHALGRETAAPSDEQAESEESGKGEVKEDEGKEEEEKDLDAVGAGKSSES